VCTLEAALGHAHSSTPFCVWHWSHLGLNRCDADYVPLFGCTLCTSAALGSFQRRCAYANAINDFLVAYETAAMDPDAVATLLAKQQAARTAGGTGDSNGGGGADTRSTPSGGGGGGQGWAKGWGDNSTAAGRGGWGGVASGLSPGSARGSKHAPRIVAGKEVVHTSEPNASSHSCEPWTLNATP